MTVPLSVSVTLSVTRSGPSDTSRLALSLALYYTVATYYTRTATALYTEAYYTPGPSILDTYGAALGPHTIYVPSSSWASANPLSAASLKYIRASA